MRSSVKGKPRFGGSAFRHVWVGWGRLGYRPVPHRLGGDIRGGRHERRRLEAWGAHRVFVSIGRVLLAGRDLLALDKRHLA